MEKIAMGGIYLAGTAQMPGFDCGSSADISFGDAVPGRELQWVKLKDGLLVADRCACTNISWNQLHEKGFVFGAPITIDDKTYLCRCLRVGAKEGEPNEWDSALDEAGEDDDLWHWDRRYFWGQEASKDWASHRAVRGYYSARFWRDSTATYRLVDVGFRPILEYLGSNPCSLDTLLGKKVKVYSPGGVAAEGYLADFSDYDILLKSNSPVVTDHPWITKEGSDIIVARENIVWLKEEKA